MPPSRPNHKSSSRGGPKAKPYSRQPNPAPKPKKQTRPKLEFIEYRYPTFAPPSNLFFRSETNWDTTKLKSSIRSISFGNEFDIKDSHLEALVAAGPDFCSTLVSISLGTTDNGYGGSVSDTAVISLAKACPKLRHAKFEACTKLTDAALLALATHCKDIVFIEISGHDKGNGRITTEGLKALQKDKKIGVGLKHLHLMDQGHGGMGKACKALSKARKGLAVAEGTTDGDGYAAQMVVSMGGGGSVTTWFGGKAVGEEDSDDMRGGYGEWW